MYNLFAENFVVVNNDIFFVPYEINLLCRLDMLDEKLEVLGKIPQVSINTERLIADIVYWNNQLIFTPLRAEKIWIYSLLEDKWEGIELPEDIRQISYKSKGACLWKNKIIMPGYGYQGMIVMELETRKVFGVEFQDEKCNEEVDGCFWGNNFVKKDNYIYLASLQSNMVVTFDMDSYKYESFQVGEESNRYIAIGWDGNKYWLAPHKNGSYVIWDGKNTAKSYDFPPVYEKQKFYFWGVELLPEQKMMFYGLCDKTFWVDVKNADNCVTENGVCYLAKKVEGVGCVRFLKGKIQIIYENGIKKELLCAIAPERKDYYSDSKGLLMEYFKEAGVQEKCGLDLTLFLDAIMDA